MVTISHESPKDFEPREGLLDRAFGARRKRKTSERLREGRLAADGLSFSVHSKSGRLIGTVRLWNVIAGSAGPALLLGPIAVDCRHQRKGIGAALMAHAIAEAKRLGHAAILLVGDAPYYARFGFDGDLVRHLHLPGPVDRDRFLGLELAPNALDGAEGLVMASGRIAEIEEARRAA
jgi:predicted N-acetyltransferase YhbS